MIDWCIFLSDIITSVLQAKNMFYQSIIIKFLFLLFKIFLKLYRTFRDCKMIENFCNLRKQYLMLNNIYTPQFKKY